jgi:sporulation protein YlmC with PRC-barrel domain
VRQMASRISNIYGMDIYTDGGGFLGRVQDIIVDLEKGEVVRLTMEPLNFLVSKEEAMRILKEKSILYKSVKSVEDVVIVTKTRE